MKSKDLRLNVVIDLSNKDNNGATNLDYRDFSLEDTTDYGSIDLSELSGYFVIKSPLGDILWQGSFDNPDIEQDSNRDFSIVVPLDSYGNPIYGDYEIEYYVSHDNKIYELKESINICEKPKGSVELTFDCNKSFALGKDKTKYKSNSSVDRQLVLAPPIGAKYIDGSDVTDFVSTSNQVLSNALWTETWQLLLRAVVTENVIKGQLTVEILNYVEARQNGSASCNINICSLMNCFDKELERLERKASVNGGANANISEQMLALSNLYIKLQGARECGNLNKASKYYGLLKDKLDCDCGCGGSGVPEYVYPLVSPQGSDTVVEGSQYVSVTSNTIGNTTTYTVAISTVLVNLINAVKQYDIESSDDTINVDTSSVGGSVLFDITVNIDEVDELFGDKVDASGFSTETSLSGIVQDLVDEAKKPKEAPVAEDDIIGIFANEVGTCLVTQNDFFSSNVTVSIDTAPINGNATVLGDNKTIEYTPNANWDGTDVLTYKITDSYGQTSTATLTIIVQPEAGVNCAVITAQFVSTLSVQSGLVQISIQNITNYLTNVPTSNNYVIEVRDSSNNIIHTYNQVGNNNSVPQVITLPDTPDSLWDNIRIAQTLVSENNLGASCGTVMSDNVYNIPDINVSIFAGVTVSCLGLSNSDPDTAILQALVDGVCNPNVTADNGLEMDGNEVILGGELNKKTKIVGDYDLTMDVRTFGNDSSPDKDNHAALVGKNKRYVEPGDDFNAVGATGQMFVRFFEDTDLDLMDHPFFAGHLSQLEVIAKDDTDDNIRANIEQSKSKYMYSPGVVGHLITTSVGAETGKCKIDRVTGEYISKLERPLNSDVEVETFIQHYLAKQDHDVGFGRTVLAAERYGYYQEGSGTVNYFGGEILMNGLKNKSSLATDVDGVIIDGASDERLKENIQDLQVGLDEVLKLRAVKYNFKKETKRGSENRIGFIAQEVREVVPELIEGAETETEYLNVKYQEAVPLLVKAIQELSAKVEELEDRLNNQ